MMLDEEMKTLNQAYDSLKVSSDKELELLRSKVQEQTTEINRLTSELDSVRKKYDDIIKGGEHADSHTKKFIVNLETELAESKRSNEKFK